MRWNSTSQYLCVKNYLFSINTMRLIHSSLFHCFFSTFSSSSSFFLVHCNLWNTTNKISSGNYMWYGILYVRCAMVCIFSYGAEKLWVVLCVYVYPQCVYDITLRFVVVNLHQYTISMNIHFYMLEYLNILRVSVCECVCVCSGNIVVTRIPFSMPKYTRTRETHREKKNTDSLLFPCCCF